MSSNVRFEAILSVLRPCGGLLDVGTDHAILPALAVLRGIAQRAIAADLREGPLQEARRTVARLALEARIDVVRADGLGALEHGAIDAVAVAGMGGSLICRICRAAPRAFDRVTQLVLQPNSAPAEVRVWARSNGWHLHAECMVFDRGHFYTICAFARGVGPDPSYASTDCSEAAELEVGPLLLQRKDPILKRYCDWQVHRLTALQGRLTRTPERVEDARALFGSARDYLA